MKLAQCHLVLYPELLPHLSLCCWAEATPHHINLQLPTCVAGKAIWTTGLVVCSSTNWIWLKEEDQRYKQMKWNSSVRLLVSLFEWNVIWIWSKDAAFPHWEEPAEEVGLTVFWYPPWTTGEGFEGEGAFFGLSSLVGCTHDLTWFSKQVTCVQTSCPMIFLYIFFSLLWL